MNRYVIILKKSCKFFRCGIIALKDLSVLSVTGKYLQMKYVIWNLIQSNLGGRGSYKPLPTNETKAIT